MSRVMTSPTTGFDDAGAGGSWLPPVRDVSSWGLSLGAHIAVLALLGMFHFTVAGQAVTTLIDSAFEEQVDTSQYAFSATAFDQLGGEGPLNPLATSQLAASVASSVTQESQANIVEKVDENFSVGVPVSEGIAALPRAEMLASVGTAGGSDHVSGGVEGAIDRMAHEIATSLREHKTLVIWLFDVSPSLHDKREKIASRVENIYNQLNEMNVGADKALKSAVATFGEKTTIVTSDPLDDTAEVVKAVRGIKSEDSGKEYVFNAISTAAKKWLTFRTRQNRSVMIVVVTDEAGSDPEKLEDAIRDTKRFGMRCYVIGEGAPLGRREVVIPNYTMANGDTVIGVMDRGPESYFQDRLKMPYWGDMGRSLDDIPSGFGPYALTRLCHETNGLFLISDSDQRRFNIDPVVMRSYPPDYRPIPYLERDIQSNLAKKALKEVCEKYQLDNENIPIPTLFFPAENDNVLRTAVTDAQRPLAELDYRLDEILKHMEAGEKDRAKISEPRWRAVFDLAMGRAAAMRTRSFGYGMMLAEMKSSPRKFEKQGSNAWRLEASKDISSGAATKKLAAKAQEYLKRVVDEHGGTPWAALAERELSRPMGWEWKESTYTPPTQNTNQGNPKTGPRFAEEVDPKTGKKTKRMIPDAPQRREI